jgi:hypothetical protein
MFSRNRLVAATFAVALATAVTVQAAGAHGSKAPRTLLSTTRPIRAFAQDTGRIVWVDGKWNVEARALGYSTATGALLGSTIVAAGDTLVARRGQAGGLGRRRARPWPRPRGQPSLSCSTSERDSSRHAPGSRSSTLKPA